MRWYYKIRCYLMAPVWKVTRDYTAQPGVGTYTHITRRCKFCGLGPSYHTEGGTSAS